MQEPEIVKQMKNDFAFNRQHVYTERLEGTNVRSQIGLAVANGEEIPDIALRHFRHHVEDWAWYQARLRPEVFEEFMALANANKDPGESTVFPFLKR